MSISRLGRLLGLAALLNAAGPGAAWAVGKTYSQSSGNNASTGANWTGPGAPSNGDDVVIPAGQPFLTWDLTRDIGSFTMNSGFNNVVGFESLGSSTFTIGFNVDGGTVEFRDNFGPFRFNASGVTVRSGRFHVGKTSIFMGEAGVSFSSMTILGGSLDLHDQAVVQSTVIYAVQGSTLNMYNNNLTGPPVLDGFPPGPAQTMNLRVDGTINISSAVFKRLHMTGFQIGPNANFLNNYLSSATFAGPLVGGSTAFNFLGGASPVFVATFSGVDFADTNIAVNVNALNLFSPSRITMLDSLGPRSGPAFENDPSGFVDWTLSRVSNLSAVTASTHGAVLLAWNWPHALPAGSSFYVQVATISTPVWALENAKLVVTTGPIVNGQYASFLAGGLEMRRNAAGADVTPLHYFRIFAKALNGSLSPSSNEVNATPTATPDPVTANDALGGPGTPGGGFRSTLNGNFANSSDFGKGVAKDSAGNIYLAGKVYNGSNADIFVRKYNNAGAVLWTSFYNSQGNGLDAASGVAVDLNGNVVVTGEETRTDIGQSTNTVVLKFDSSGLRLWTTSYNGAANGADVGNEVAVDGSGFIYVAGSEQVAGQGRNVWVRKYDTAGLEMWTTTYNNAAVNADDEATAIVADNSGNTYVAGYENNTAGNGGTNIWVRKYNSSALVQWTTTYTSAGNALDQADAVTLDNFGNSVFVVGDESASGQKNIWIRKFSASDALVQWTTTFSGVANLDDEGSAAAMGPDNSLYVSGVEGTAANGKDHWIRKFNQINNPPLVLWTTTYNGPANLDDYANSIVVDGSSNVFVGASHNVSGELENALLRKYNGDAFLSPVVGMTAAPASQAGAVTLSWTWPETLLPGSSYYIHYATWPIGFPDIAKAQIVSSATITQGMNVSRVVGGLDTGRNASDGVTSPSYNFAVFIKSPAGTPSPASNSPSSVPSIVGAVSTATFTNFGAPGTPGGGWLHTFSESPFFGNDAGYAVMHDNGPGGVYVAGIINNGAGNDDIFVRKYDTNGGTQWTRYYNSPANGNETAQGLWVGGGYVYVTGWEYRGDLGQGDNLILLKYTTDGLREWTTSYNNSQNFDDNGIDVDVDAANGFIYVAGRETRSVSGQNVLVQKYDKNALLLWTTTYNSPNDGSDTANGVSVYGGDVYVTGEEATSGQGQNLFLRKMDAGALLQWTTYYNGPGSLTDRGNAVAADASGVYVAGDESVTGANRDQLLIKYNASAQVQWKTTYNGPSGGDDALHDVALDGDNVYVSGREEKSGEGVSNIFVRKYGKANALIEWTTTYAGPGNGGDEGLSLHVSLASNVFVSGYERKSAGLQDNVWVRKYNKDAFQGVSVGTTKIWAGTPGGNASVSSNWFDGFAPVAGDYVIFGATNPLNNCNWDLAVTLSSITINSLYKATVSFNTPLTVTGIFDLLGGATVQFTDNPSNRHELRGSNFVNGTFHVGQTTVVAQGAVNVSGGILEMHDGAMFQGSSITVQNGGRLRLYDNNLVGPPILDSTSPVTSLEVTIYSRIDISSAVFRRLSKDGLRISGAAVFDNTAVGAPFASSISSVTFQGPLPAGTTAINFILPTGNFISTFTNINFADPNIAVNVNASTLSVNARITMRDFKGPQAGPPFEIDPSTVVDWIGGGGAGGAAGITTLAALPGANVGSVRLNWTWPEQVNIGSSYHIQYSTYSGVVWSKANAQITVATGPVNLGFGGGTHTVGGLDIGHDGAGVNISPNYFFRVFITSGANVSPSSNQAASTATLPAQLVTTFNDFGSSGLDSGWLSRFNHPANSFDEANGVARSAAGDVYVTGRVDANELFLRKYSPSGNVLWTKYYNSVGNSTDEGLGVVVGSSGDVYVAGYENRADLGQSSNLLVMKYQSSGLLEWTTTYNSPANNTDQAFGVAVDDTGVYVAGHETRSDLGQAQNIIVRKYSDKGLLLWTSSYNGPANGDDQAWDIAVHGGFAYVSGFESVAGQATNIWLTKYDAGTGAPQWTRTYNGPANTNDSGEGVAADEGGIYISGYESRGDVSQSSNAWVRKYDSGGNAVWTSTFNLAGGNTDELSNDVAVSPVGVIVGGYQNGPAATANIWVRKYDQGGLVQWTTGYNSPDNNFDRVFGVDIDASGVVYAVGYENRTSPAQANDVWVRRYNADAFGGGAGGGAVVRVVSQPLAPPGLGTSTNTARMMRLGLWTEGGSVTLSSMTITLFGDAPAPNVAARIYKDDNPANGVIDAGENLLNYLFFAAGAPPKINMSLSASVQTLTSATNYYIVAVEYSSVPAGKRLELALDFPVDVGLSGGSVYNGPGGGFPHRSGETKVVVEVYARPASQLPVSYSTPAASFGGFDSGFYISAGQRVNVEASGLWDVGAGNYNANGDGGGVCGACVLASTNSTRLMGRVGGGNWFALGTSSTFTATGSGNLYLAINDDVYTNNSGSVTVSYRILPSNVVKYWRGGNSAFPNRASLDDNWNDGKKPFANEKVEFSTNNVNCDWDLSNLILAELRMTTDYTGILRLVNSPPGVANNLTVTTHVVLERGTFELGSSNVFAVQGVLTVKSSATLDLGQGGSDLKTKGITLTGNAFLRSNVAAGIHGPNLEPVTGGSLWPFIIKNATISVSGVFDAGAPYIVDSSVLEIHEGAKINSMQGILIEGLINNLTPSVKFKGAHTAALTFNNWGFESIVSSNVDTSEYSGPGIVFNNASGAKFGSPFEKDAAGKVTWNPDGGGSASIAGTLYYGPGGGGVYRVLVTTDSGGGATAISSNAVVSLGAYTVSNLPAPNTWYVFAFKDGNADMKPDGQEPRGGYNNVGSYRSDAIFLTNGQSATSKDIQIRDWSTISGNLIMNTGQTGAVRVQAWRGDPPCGGCTLENQVIAPYGGNYTINTSTHPTTRTTIIAYVDVDNNKTFDSAFEAFGSSANLNPLALGTLSPVDVTVAGGSAQAGGTVALSTAVAHSGAVGENGAQPFIKVDLLSSGGNSTLNSMKLEYVGAMPSNGVTLEIYADLNLNGQFDNTLGGSYLDGFRGSLFLSGSASTGTVAFFTPDTLEVGKSKTYFLTVSFQGQRNFTGGVKISSTSSFGLSAGAMATNQGALYPSQATAPVRFRVPGDFFAYTDNSGGAFTQFSVFAGQSLSLTASGSWSTAPFANAVGPAGAGPTGLNTTLPAAKVGELIGRVHSFDYSANLSSGAWFRVGTSTTVTVKQNGELVLAMNDFVGSYSDNRGEAFVEFSLAGSTVGVLSGTAYYGNPENLVTTASMTVVAYIHNYPSDPGVAKASTTLILAANTTYYPYTLTGLGPGFYSVRAQVLTSTHTGYPNHRGDSGERREVVKGSTTAIDVRLTLGFNTISGNLSYSGLQNFGNFKVAATTHTAFDHDPVIFGSTVIFAPGGYTLFDLPVPNTYYIVAFRDANFNGIAEGAEAFGGTTTITGAGIADFNQYLIPVFLPQSGSPTINGQVDTNIEITLFDKGAINGFVNVPPGASGDVVIQAGRGARGTPEFFIENTEFLAVTQPVPPAGYFYRVSLLRPATDYTVFAFLDANRNEELDATEPFFESPPIAVSSAATNNVSFALNVAPPPSAVTGFRGAAAANAVDFTWNLLSGATEYRLRDINGAALYVLSSTNTAGYLKHALSPNAASSIRQITASNAQGTGPAALIAAVYSSATTPSVTTGAVTATSLAFSWTSTNPGGTVFEVHRATGDNVGPFQFILIATISATSFTSGNLAPSTTYFWKVRALNGNNIPFAFSNQISTQTSAASGASISGTITYTGSQAGFIVIEAAPGATPPYNCDSNFAAVPTVQVKLPNIPTQSYYLPGLIGSSAYHIRAFVDVRGQAMTPTVNYPVPSSVDRTTSCASVTTLAATPLTNVNFSIFRDTVAPNPPAGLTAQPQIGRVNLAWSAPTSNANGSPIPAAPNGDILGYRVERSSGIGPDKPIVNLTPTLVSLSSFTDSSPLTGAQNFYRVRAVDYGQNVSSPTAFISAAPPTGGSISGKRSDYTGTTSGVFRVRVSTSSVPDGPFLQESNLTDFTFSGLSSGTYFVRGFRDTDSDFKQNTSSDPAGTFGGLNTPYPIYIFGGNAVTNLDVAVCDRPRLFINQATSFSLLGSGADCPAKDAAPGNTTRLYSFPVGDGTKDSIGLGSQVDITLTSPYEGQLIVLGPQGEQVASIVGGGVTFVRFTASTPGLYLVEPTTSPFNTVPFTLSPSTLTMTVSGGLAGKISGMVSYGTLSNIKVQFFNSPASDAFPIQFTDADGTGAYSLLGLADGTYYVRAFRDLNGNFIRDAIEPTGTFGVPTSPTAITITGGVSSLGSGPADIILSDPAFGAVAGTIFNNGSQQGTIRVEVGPRACATCPNLKVAAFTSTGTGNSYSFGLLTSATDYVVQAYVDQNSNFFPDVAESYASSSPVNVVAGTTVSLSLILEEPYSGASGDASLLGSVFYGGTSTGTIYMGIARDRYFGFVDYGVNISAPGSYLKSSIVGGATYYLAGFRDRNNNQAPDRDEPTGVGSYAGHLVAPASTPTFINPVALFVPLSGPSTANLLLQDPPDGSIAGKVSYSGSKGEKIVVQAYIEGTTDEFQFNTISLNRVANTTSYNYALPLLAAASHYNVIAFVDVSSNTFFEFGEPFGEVPGQVAVSSGVNGTPVTGKNFQIFDAGGGGKLGRIDGAISYAGSQSGSFRVRLFDNAALAGNPIATHTVAAAAGPGTFSFVRDFLPLTTYYIDAFRDTTGGGYFDPYFQAYGKLSGLVYLSETEPVKSVGTLTVSDPSVVSGGAGSIAGVLGYRGSMSPTSWNGATVRSTLYVLGTTVPVAFSNNAYNSVGTSYSFPNISTGVFYALRSFIDADNDVFLDTGAVNSIGEPVLVSSATGIFVTGAVTGVNFNHCDVRGLVLPALNYPEYLGPCTNPDRDGAFVEMKTFAGKAGQAVTIEMIARTDQYGFYDTYLTLYDQFGRLLTSDDESAGFGNARISNFVLPVNGQYFFGLSAYKPGVTGYYYYSLKGSAGSLGSIAGNVEYSGSQGGQIKVGLFNAQSFSTSALVGKLDLISTMTFTFPGLLSGTSYYLGAFVDVNFNNFPDAGEDGGVFGVNGVPNAIYLQNAQNLAGVTVTIDASSSSTSGNISGSIFYPTANVFPAATTATLRVEFFASPDFTVRPAVSREVAVEDVSASSYTYDLSAPGGLSYVPRAYIDFNNDSILNTSEPRGVYSPNNQGAQPVFVPAAGYATADFSIANPGVSTAGVAGEGTAIVNVSSIAAGGSALLTVTYTVGPSGLSAGGKVGFLLPPGFGLPVLNAPAGAFSSSATFGPGGFYTLGAGQAAGATLVLTFNTVVPCLLGPSTITVAAAQNANVVPAPLSNGSPLLTVTTGTVASIALANPYFSVLQNQRSDEQKLIARDACGNQATVTGAAETVFLRGKRFEVTVATASFVTDAAVTLTSGTALTALNITTVTFGVGQSSRSLYALSSTTGSKAIELFYDLGGAGGAPPTTNYFGFSALFAQTFANVTVATVPFGVGKTSITITPGSDPQLARQAFINFTLADPNLGWHVLITSTPFKTGVTPEPVWEFWGYGQPALGQVVWEGRYSPWLNNGARVPNGDYLVRIEVAGGVKDDSLIVTVEGTQFKGQITDVGTLPRQPLDLARLDVYGPFGGGFTHSDALGNYVLPGISAGATFFVFVKREGYLDGSLTIPVDSAGAVVVAGLSASSAVLVSTNSSGGVDMALNRASSLLVVGSGVGLSTSANDRWGSLEVRQSSACGVTSASSVLFGPLRLRAGTTIFDDGGQWDPATQDYIVRTFIEFKVAPSTYAVEAKFEGLKRCATYYADNYVTDPLRLDAFTKKNLVTGLVTLAPGSLGGTFVSVNAVPFPSSATQAGRFTEVFVPGGVSQGTYTIANLDDGDYILRANVAGSTAVAVGPYNFKLSSEPVINFPGFGDGASIAGTVTLNANTTGLLTLHVSAWAPGSLNFGTTNVYRAAGASPGATMSYTIKGLQAGATYQIYANLEGGGKNLDAVQAIPVKAVASAAVDFTFAASSGVISGTIILPSGSTDFLNVDMTGEVVASPRPNQVGRLFEVKPSTNLPGFKCSPSGSAPLATGYCPNAADNKATFSVSDLNTETLDLTFHYKTTGQTRLTRVSVANGSTSTISVSLSSPTFSILGAINNQISTTPFNTNQNILANAPEIPILDAKGAPVAIDPAGVPKSTASLARVIAIRQELSDFNVAISTSFDPATSRVGYLTGAGTYTIRNLPAGVYYVRTPNLRLCAACDILVPSIGQLVRVSELSVSSVDFTLSDGFAVKGKISIDEEIVDSGAFDLTITNRRQEVVRSTTVYLGDTALGIEANAVTYSFTNLPAGEFYTVRVKDSRSRFAGRPVTFPSPALSPNGMQDNIENVDVLLKRAAFITGKLKDAQTGELITKNNATLLASNFRIEARANPWVEGGFVNAVSSVAGRPILADNTFSVGPLIPEISYDLRVGQTAWDPAYLIQGSQNYAPVSLSGLQPQPGEVLDVGVLDLHQGLTLSGTVRHSTSTGELLGNIKITARPSSGESDVLIHTFTNPKGEYTLWMSTAISKQFDIAAAPRDGNLASNGSRYAQSVRERLNLLTATTADFLLEPLSVSINGRVLVSSNAATGEGELSYPFGEKKGYPAAAVFLQPSGVVPESNPLGDIETITDETGSFEFLGLTTGTFLLRAVSLGYITYRATVTANASSFCVYSGSAAPSTCAANHNQFALTRGAILTGRIIKSDGSAPSEDEIGSIVAANFALDKYAVGSVEVDPVAKTINSYTIPGFEAGIKYDVVFKPKSEEDDVSFPPEGDDISFTESESTTTKTVNLTYLSQALDCQAEGVTSSTDTASAKALGNLQFQIKIECNKSLRKVTEADSDLDLLLTISSATSPTATSPLSPSTTYQNGINGSGELLGSNKKMSANRRKITAIYRSSNTSESNFSLRLEAFSGEIDPKTGKNFSIAKVFDFFTGLDAKSTEKCKNIDKCKVGMSPSAGDEDEAGDSENSSLSFGAGTFATTSSTDTSVAVDTSAVVLATGTVEVSISKGKSKKQAETLAMATLGYIPPGLERLGNKSAFPQEMSDAMWALSVSTEKVAKANPLSSFYSIFLPASVRHQLSQPADLTLSYDTRLSSNVANDAINIWFFKGVGKTCDDGTVTTSGYCKETRNRKLDTVNKSITVSIDHLSSFVVLDSSPVLTAPTSFAVEEILAVNFPNPSDCIDHVDVPLNATLFGAGGKTSFNGTMIRYTLPASGRGTFQETRINIYNIAGELVRVIPQKFVEGGRTHYAPWNCQSESGKTVASGVYIGEVVWGSKRKFFKIAIIKGSGL